MSEKHVVVVDDKFEIAEIIGELAQDFGFLTQWIPNAKSLQKNWDIIPCNLLILDIVMPEIDGIEVLQWLSEKNDVPPIILLSGYDEMYLKQARFLANKNGLKILETMSKPVPLQRIEEILKTIAE